MIRLISDSACDLQASYCKKNNVEIIPLYVTFDGEQYSRDKVDVDRDAFYHEMVDNKAYPKTSLPSIEDFYSKFEECVTAGDSCICITITSTLSGTFNSARNAMEMILDKYPDAKVAVYDSGQNTASQALLMHEMVRMRDAGLSYEEMNEKMPALLNSGRIFFTVHTLEYLRKGGRIGKLLTSAASKLNIRPLLLLEEGKLGIGGVSRSRKASIESVLSHTEKFFADRDKGNFIFTVGHGYDREEGMQFRSTVKERLGISLMEDVLENDFLIEIGAVTACHTGPQAIGIGFIQKYETL